MHIKTQERPSSFLLFCSPLVALLELEERAHEQSRVHLFSIWHLLTCHMKAMRRDFPGNHAFRAQYVRREKPHSAKAVILEQITDISLEGIHQSMYLLCHTDTGESPLKIYRKNLINFEVNEHYGTGPHIECLFDIGVPDSLLCISLRGFLPLKSIKHVA